ncbi:hypothetical protein G6F31_021147 [Rhizopus arrhizus]|nr:hypothetical protein G6F31_021147 [Rhizopus arrhizus]
MARVFAAATPPSSPVLLHYGAEFPDFIASFPPAEPLPYLADVARIERAATEAFHAAVSAPPFRAPGAFAIPSLHHLEDEHLGWHASTR